MKPVIPAATLYFVMLSHNKNAMSHSELNANDPPALFAWLCVCKDSNKHAVTLPNTIVKKQ